MHTRETPVKRVTSISHVTKVIKCTWEFPHVSTCKMSSIDTWLWVIKGVINFRAHGLLYFA